MSEGSRYCWWCSAETIGDECIKDSLITFVIAAAICLVLPSACMSQLVA
jgi:hypothetical protein